MKINEERNLVRPVIVSTGSLKGWVNNNWSNPKLTPLMYCKKVIIPIKRTANARILEINIKGYFLL